MEPLYVKPLNLQQSDDPDDFAKYEAKGASTTLSNMSQRALQDLQSQIYKYKETLFQTVVNHDNDHDASDLGAMMKFHAIFLQSVAYWIGMLDNTPVPPPRFKGQQLQSMVQSITQAIQVLVKSSGSARTLVYQVLFRFSTQHAFDLGPQKKREDE
jgi:hypothetical protein